ncbi:MAG: amidase family protein [Gammaproteobacteria bacterium]|nr:amidase family protein [Gammaproteobacteria bacterium]
MDNLDLCFMSATELASAIKAKKVSPVEVTEAVIARIEALEPKLNAFATFTPELALDAAKEAEKSVTSGAELGDLHGVGVSIKDLTLTAGVPTQRGSRILAGDTPRVDAPVVSRIKQAGGILLGKTTTPEFGWKGVSQSPLTGITSNPWKLGYNAGASSAGAGVGAAAGFGPLHQGSDGAGSIRMPAHFCGVFGLKPSFGRIPNLPVPNNDLTSHIGPITRCVADAALFLKVMAGHHPVEHTTIAAPVPDYPGLLSADVSTLKIAFSSDLGHARVDNEVGELVAAAVDVFADLGCRVEEITPAFGPLGPEIGRFFWTVHETNLAHYLEQWEAEMDPGLVACIKAGGGHSAEEYLAMRARKLEYVRQIHEFMQDWDLLMTPAVSVAAFPADRLQPEHWPQHPWDWISWAEFSYPFNMSGNPAASVPCGFTEAGLPVGLQIVGKRADELSVLRAAAAFESSRPWDGKRPML